MQDMKKPGIAGLRPLTNPVIFLAGFYFVLICEMDRLF